jgi:predicted nucleic acid-binding protein
MDRLFLDANVLFSAAYKRDARVLRLWRLNDVALFSSRYAFEEARFNLAEESHVRRLMALSRKVRFVEASGRELPRGVSLPEKDAPILLAAIEGQADYLLTGDFRHFGPYFGKKIEGVTVTLPSQYLKLKNHGG